MPSSLLALPFLIPPLHLSSSRYSNRYAGKLEHIFESVTAGITVQSPQLDINTVAAGGGSRLFFKVDHVVLCRLVFA